MQVLLKDGELQVWVGHHRMTTGCTRGLRGPIQSIKVFYPFSLRFSGCVLKQLQDYHLHCKLLQIASGHRSQQHLSISFSKLQSFSPHKAIFCMSYELKKKCIAIDLILILFFFGWLVFAALYVPWSQCLGVPEPPGEHLSEPIGRYIFKALDCSLQSCHGATAAFGLDDLPKVMLAKCVSVSIGPWRTIVPFMFLLRV